MQIVKPPQLSRPVSTWHPVTLHFCMLSAFVSCLWIELRTALRERSVVQERGVGMEEVRVQTGMIAESADEIFILEVK